MQGLLDSAPVASPVVSCVSRSVLLANTASAPLTDCKEVFAVNSALPASLAFDATLPAGCSSGYFQVLLGPTQAENTPSAIGELSFSLDKATEEPSAFSVEVSMDVEGKINMNVTAKTSKKVVAELALLPSV